MATQTKQLRKNTYTTYRDPITGQWLVLKEEQQAA